MLSLSDAIAAARNWPDGPLRNVEEYRHAGDVVFVLAAGLESLTDAEKDAAVALARRIYDAQRKPEPDADDGERFNLFRHLGRRTGAARTRR